MCVLKVLLTSWTHFIHSRIYFYLLSVLSLPRLIQPWAQLVLDLDFMGGPLL